MTKSLVRAAIAACGISFVLLACSASPSESLAASEEGLIGLRPASNYSVTLRDLRCRTATLAAFRYESAGKAALTRLKLNAGDVASLGVYLSKAAAQICAVPDADYYAAWDASNAADMLERVTAQFARIELVSLDNARGDLGTALMRAANADACSTLNVRALLGTEASFQSALAGMRACLARRIENVGQWRGDLLTANSPCTSKSVDGLDHNTSDGSTTKTLTTRYSDGSQVKQVGTYNEAGQLVKETQTYSGGSRTFPESFTVDGYTQAARNQVPLRNSSMVNKAYATTFLGLGGVCGLLPEPFGTKTAGMAFALIGTGYSFLSYVQDYMAQQNALTPVTYSDDLDVRPCAMPDAGVADVGPQQTHDGMGDAQSAPQEMRCRDGSLPGAYVCCPKQTLGGAVFCCRDNFCCTSPEARAPESGCFR